MTNLIFTKEPEWLNKWDVFLIKNQRGSHLVLSDWLKSYKSYGFDYELGILLVDGQIVGGIGAVIPKFLFFKFYIVPHGPIVIEGYEHKFNDCILALKARAKSLKCCYAQISIPVSDNKVIAAQSYLPDELNLSETGFLKGKLFDYIYCTYGLNWITFNDLKDENDLLKKLGSHARRNIKTAYASELILSEANTEKAIIEAYKLVELNAQNSGYSVRSFDEVKKSINDLVNKGIGVFLIAHKNDEIKGSAFFIKTNSSLTYLFGGTLKEKPDLRIGYFLHWEAIKIAFRNNCTGYNISMGGSKGVLRFKQQFNADQLFYLSPHHYVILNKPIFNIFIFFKEHLKIYKKHLSTLLSKFNRK